MTGSSRKLPPKRLAKKGGAPPTPGDTPPFLHTPARNPTGKFFNYFLRLHQSLNDQDHNQDRQHESQITFHPVGHLHTRAPVCLFLIILKSPSITGGTEQQIDQRTDGKQQVAYNEILQILDRSSRSPRLEIRPYVEAQNTGHRQDDDQDHIDHCRFLSGDVEQFHITCQNILKHRDDRRERREEQEQEEE